VLLQDLLKLSGIVDKPSGNNRTPLLPRSIFLQSQLLLRCMDFRFIGL